MGKLLEQIKTEPLNTGGKKSTVDVLLESLKGQDKKDLLEALRDAKISAIVISNVLANNGMQINRSAIMRWRLREGI